MYHFLKTDMGAGQGKEPPWTVGESRTITTTPVLCWRGYHASPTVFDALRYAPGPILCEVELTGEVLTDTDKSVGQGRRLIAAVNIERELRVFACDCAERVLPSFEAKRPEDRRPREAIRIARLFIEGQATRHQLEAAAEAAGVAAEAAWGAAWAAARAARVARAAARAARAARVAAEAAGATWAAAERSWQKSHLDTLVLPLLQAASPQAR